MPKFGLTMQEGTIQQWFKAEGDRVNKGEPLFEVETEKVLYEVETPAGGTLARVLYPAEATVACARVLAVIALDGEDPAAIAARYDPTRAPVTLPRTVEAAPALPASAVPPAGAGTPVTPAARKLAKEQGMDLATVRGSGPGGRITREDVEAALSRNVAPTRPAVSSAAPGGSPLRGRRKAIAEHMLRSLQSTAQLTITTEDDVSALVARRQRWQAEFSLTYTDLILEAAASALRTHPRLNATFQAGLLQEHGEVHIGLAVALDDGLVVPVIRNADRKTLREIAAESLALAEKARRGTLGVDDVSGGTFTVTNLGMYGVDAFTPVLHTPQIAVLGVGRILDKPAVHEGRVAPRAMMVLSLTFDHRVVDGAPAAVFLRSVVEHLQA